MDRDKIIQICVIISAFAICFLIHKYRNTIFGNKDKKEIKNKSKPKLKPKSKPKPKPIFEQKTKRKFKPEIQQKKDLVFLDISINNEKFGRIIIELFSDITPKTCNNFRTLCNAKNKMSYINSQFHRIIKDFMIQGGDFTNGDGTGGMSVYGNRFEDENFILKHNKPYLLSMANAGKDTNGSQFFITTTETPHLDGKHVVFGQVIEGFEYIDKLNTMQTNERDRPIHNVVISNCGTL
jgi:cyclophilin family peptidyl-prolyl cis-trans isomerase